MAGLCWPSCPVVTWLTKSMRQFMTQIAGLIVGLGPAHLIPMVVRRQCCMCHVYGLWGGTEAVTSRLPVTEAEQNRLMESADKWLPKLSDQLSLACKTYPVLVHSMPGTFDTSINGEDIVEIINKNEKFIEHPSVIQCVELLPHKRAQVSNRENCMLII